MTHFFQFEQDFVETLHCIPMQVRYKLDTCGIKLKLAEWNQLTQAERHQLIAQPCDIPADVQVYRQTLMDLVKTRAGSLVSDLAIDPNPPWQNPDQIPASVQAKAQTFGVTIQVSQWADLSLLQRFALIKLSRASHENGNFLPALQEFGLM
jgi:hypothetical protein